MAHPKQVGHQEALADMAAGGALALTKGPSEDYRGVRVNQTTAGQTITIPAPSNASIETPFYVQNVGTVDFNVGGRQISPGSYLMFVWDGSAYSAPVDATNTPEIQEVLTPTATDTIPDLANAVAPGTIVKVMVGDAKGLMPVVPAAISVSPAGVFTITSAVLGYPIETTDIVMVYYTPA